ASLSLIPQGAGCLGQDAVRLAFQVRGRDLAAVDEVLQLFLVLVGVPVGLVAEDAPLLDEVLESGAGVAPGAEAELACGLGRRERAAPAQQVEQLRREERDARLPDRE